MPGGTSATVTKKLGGADVVGGRGYHTVKYQSYTWTPMTKVGETPTAVKK